MIAFTLATILAFTPEQETVHRFCANAVGIPYASDNFTDKEWNDFQACVKFHTRHIDT